jgi:thiol-disulfide isomerase/thioredoxin
MEAGAVKMAAGFRPLVTGSLAALLSTGAVAAADPGSFALNLPLSGGYILEVDGHPDAKARFFEGDPPQQVVVMSGDGAGFVLDRPTQSVRRLERRLVRDSAPASLTLLPGAAGEPLPGGYQADGPGVRFRDTAHSYYVTMKPPLVGELTVEQILAHSPEFRLAMDQYTPAAAAIEALKHCASSARIEVFFGSWCPHCRHRIPLLLKALEMAKGTPMAVRIVGLPCIFGQEKVALERGVKSVPTLIAYDGLREVGRMQGQDWEHPEESLARLLPAAGR